MALRNWRCVVLRTCENYVTLPNNTKHLFGFKNSTSACYDWHYRRRPENSEIYIANDTCSHGSHYLWRRTENQTGSWKMSLAAFELGMTAAGNKLVFIFILYLSYIFGLVVAATSYASLCIFLLAKLTLCGV